MGLFNEYYVPGTVLSHPFTHTIINMCRVSAMCRHLHKLSSEFIPNPVK